MKKCYSCGAVVPENSKFCPKCGKSLQITQDMIDSARSNDQNAQTELYERTYQAVYSRIRAKVPDEDAVMDIMQETYLRAFTNLDQLQAPSAFMSWLFTIAHSQTSNWYRKNKNELENVQISQMEYENDEMISGENDLLEEPEYREEFSPDLAIDREETKRLLAEILDTLPEDQRIILTMRYYDEMSLKEISEELGVNLNTVKTRLAAGKRKVEAKVLKLEKSGTKLYSLGPISFLVYLLHNAELFAPSIPANTIIAMTGTGTTAVSTGGTAVSVHASTESTGSASVKSLGNSVGSESVEGGSAVVKTGNAATEGVSDAAASNAAATAVKSTTGAVARGVGAKIVAAVAAVAVFGGAVTAAIMILNNNTETNEEGIVSESQWSSGPNSGVIKSMTVRDQDGRDTNYYTYDRNGNMLTDTVFYTDGTVYTLSENTYDNNGILLTSTETWFDSNSNTESLLEINYDSNGGRAEAKYSYSGNGNAWKTEENTYDQEGNWLTYISYNEGGGITESYNFEYTYDDYGNELTCTIYNGEGDVVGEVGNGEDYSHTYRNEYTYDSNGNILTRTYYDWNGKPSYQDEYTYDSEENTVTESRHEWLSSVSVDNGDATVYFGNLVSERIFDKNGNMLSDIQYETTGTTVHEYTYDDEGNMLSESFHSDSYYYSYGYEYTYDSEGILLTDTEYDENGNIKYITSYEYTYDENGNKASCTEKFFDSPTGNSAENLLYTYLYEYYD